jgi:two-component system KDP operon response regulator KdpE
MKRYKVLVVDDQPKLVRLLTTNLKTQGYEIIEAGTGKQAIELAAREMPDVVILDLMLPDMSGFEVCDQLRAMSDVPILMLTARTRDTDKLHGFRVGADDYITKPFNIEELLARVAVALRRSAGAPATPTATEIGPLRVDPVARRVTVGGEPVHLTPTEYSLLSYLVANQGKVLLHEQVLAHVWGPEYADSVDYLRVYIAHLRRKLGAEAGRLIRTITGVGYTVDSGAEQGPSA